MITYVSIAFLKLFGVAYPLKYRQKISRKTCIRIVQINARRLPLTPLLSGLFTFTIFHAPYALYAIYLTPLFTDLCFYLIQYKLVQLRKIIKEFIGINKNNEGGIESRITTISSNFVLNINETKNIKEENKDENIIKVSSY
uniref:7TM_GPCR_Srx domain-containing protein n=1 Tax=Meloidogyne hapla TaxID=6305 RepID=A0A1I8B8C1_MELHA